MDGAIRIDKWLWYARFFKTRALAQRIAESGLIRLNGTRVVKSAAPVGPGDIVTLARGREVVSVKVLACASRRCPAPEAQRLYQILSETGLDREPSPP